jgi:EmrB/QacA subfamily drug resistance transporter
LVVPINYILHPDSPSPSDEEERLRLRVSRPTYAITATVIVVVGTLLVAVNVTMVNVALPTIGRDLNVTAGLDWLVTAYLLAVAAAQPLTGWLCERFGSTQTYVASIIMFSAGSLLVGLAGTMELAVAARILQGLGGGAMLPVGMTLVHQLFSPDRRGAALGYLGMAVMAGPAAGPVVGGWLVDAAHWRLIFLLNVPVGLVLAVAAARLLRDGAVTSRPRFDWQGIVLIGIALPSLLLASSSAASLGWTTAPVMGLALLAVVAILLFITHELRTAQPLVDVRMFNNKPFTLSIAVIWLSTAGHLVVLVLLPVLLQAVYGLSGLRAGLLLTPSAVCAAIVMPLSGRWSDRSGPRVPVVLGLASSFVVAWLLANLAFAASTWWILAIMVLHGLGIGLSSMTVTATALNVVPTRMVNQASAVRAVNRQVSAALTVGLAAAIITNQAGGLAPTGVPSNVLLAAYHSAFLVIAGLMAASVLLALALPGRRQHLTIQEHRMAEYAALAAE